MKIFSKLFVFFIFSPSSLLANHDQPYTINRARDIWRTLDFVSAFLSPGVNSRAELVPSPRAYARNGASRRWIGDNIVWTLSHSRKIHTPTIHGGNFCCLEGKNLLLIKAKYIINRIGGLQHHISCVGMMWMFSEIIHLCLGQLSILKISTFYYPYTQLTLY